MPDAPQPRRLDDVVARILALIPSPGWDDLRNQLNAAVESWRYAAPEMQPLAWQRVSRTLAFFLGTPLKGWRQEVSDIIEGRK